MALDGIVVTLDNSVVVVNDSRSGQSIFTSTMGLRNEIKQIPKHNTSKITKHKIQIIFRYRIIPNAERCNCGETSWVSCSTTIDSEYISFVKSVFKSDQKLRMVNKKALIASENQSLLNLFEEIENQCHMITYMYDNLHYTYQKMKNTT